RRSGRYRTARTHSVSIGWRVCSKRCARFTPSSPVRDRTTAIMFSRRHFLAAAALPAAAQEATSHRPKGIGPLKITDARTLRSGDYDYFKIFTDGGVTGVGEPSHSNGELNADFLEKLI